MYLSMFYFSWSQICNWGNVHKTLFGWKTNIIMDLKETGCNVVDSIHLAQDMDQWRTLVNTVMNLRYHKMRGIS
jgi:hypothetical protein